MKQARSFAQVVVSRKGARALAFGHPWVYAGEVIAVRPAPTTGEPAANGDIVDIVDEGGSWHGAGFLSELSTIRVRVVSRNPNDTFDEAFWHRRIAWAWQHRVVTMGARGLGSGVGAGGQGQDASPTNTNDLACCRVVFGEADGFPGLVVDRYGPVLVAQVGTVGMERLRPCIYPLLLDVLQNSGEDVHAIFERCDAPSRAKEGLEARVGWWAGPADSHGAALWGTSKDAALPAQPTALTIHENGIAYAIDLAGGQKTGFFLDQKYNRRAVARISMGKRVLDCFTHVGAFGLNAAQGGAHYVRCVDASGPALSLARANARLNGFVIEDDGNDTNTMVAAPHVSPSASIMGFTQADVLEYLPRLRCDRATLRAEGGPFDVIVLDPPAFAKRRDAVRGALRGYREINAEAMRLLPRGGYLATCSCSQHMSTELLSRAIAEAAHGANKQLRQVEQRQQSPDHPVLWGFPQSHYLDFFIFQVV